MIFKAAKFLLDKEDYRMSPLPSYARHGRDLMGCDSTKLVEVKSHVCEPCNVVRHDKSTRRRQGRNREAMSEGSQWQNCEPTNNRLGGKSSFGLCNRLTSVKSRPDHLSLIKKTAAENSVFESLDEDSS